MFIGLCLNPMIWNWKLPCSLESTEFIESAKRIVVYPADFDGSTSGAGEELTSLGQ